MEVFTSMSWVVSRASNSGKYRTESTAAIPIESNPFKSFVLIGVRFNKDASGSDCAKSRLFCSPLGATMNLL